MRLCVRTLLPFWNVAVVPDGKVCGGWWWYILWYGVPTKGLASLRGGRKRTSALVIG